MNFWNGNFMENENKNLQLNETDSADETGLTNKNKRLKNTSKIRKERLKTTARHEVNSKSRLKTTSRIANMKQKSAKSASFKKYIVIASFTI